MEFEEEQSQNKAEYAGLMELAWRTSSNDAPTTRNNVKRERGILLQNFLSPAKTVQRMRLLRPRESCCQSVTRRLTRRIESRKALY